MSIKTINDIRNSYLSFFEAKMHLRTPSASLLPTQDPSLLFTTAGMVPFKDYFSGAKKAPANRLVSVQKCLRTTDLEIVGKTKRHLSFFEMLGNFSFGDYFKKEAIEFAWEYSTEFLPFPKDKIWISIFENDDEAFEIWTKHIGVPKERMVRLGRADNFWGPAGESGACGPCSELYIDRGEEFGTDSENQAPGGSGDRFMEFWNLVFNQFDFQKGQYLPLAQTGIDTGAGLERLATLVQGVDSVFDTDELMQLRNHAATIFNANYTGDAVVPLRVLTDHIRTLTFGMSDGIFPSNESRGYVLRRVLRRAMLFGRKLGQKEPLLHKLCASVSDIYGQFYTELKENIPFITNYIHDEEKRFLTTLDSGAQRLEQLIAQQRDTKGKMLAGKDVFQLYDTFGFPLEMTVELAEIENLTVDTAGFRAEMEKQKERGRAAWKGTLDLPLNRNLKTSFTGYEQLIATSTVENLISGKDSVSILNESTGADGLNFLITKTTPFYAEGGGQLGDNGVVKGKTGSARIVDCRKQGDAYVHMLSNIEGSLETGESVELSVDRERREALARHHSATHLLNAALKRVLGKHIKQTGSLVHPDYLRFDFSHPRAMTADEIQSTEAIVYEAIASQIIVNTLELAKSEAEKRGAVMTFGEKYGDVVRVVEMGTVSAEFCGGTHVANTKDLERFFILKESSPGAGNRRIEAVAGAAAIETLLSRIEQIETIALEGKESSSAELHEITDKASKLKTRINSGHCDLSDWQSANALLMHAQVIQQDIRRRQKKENKGSALANLDEIIDEIIGQLQTAPNGLAYAASTIPEQGIPELKSLVDKLRERNAAAVYFVFSGGADEQIFVIGTTQAYATEKNLKLNEVLKAANKLGISGGGKAELIQGKLSGGIDAIIAHFVSGQ